METAIEISFEMAAKEEILGKDGFHFSICTMHYRYIVLCKYTCVWKTRGGILIDLLGLQCWKFWFPKLACICQWIQKAFHWITSYSFHLGTLDLYPGTSSWKRSHHFDGHNWPWSAGGYRLFTHKVRWRNMSGS